jgi:glucoamylase
MIEGAAFAAKMGDAGAAEWYTKQAGRLSKALDLHWSEERGFIVSGYEGNSLRPIRSGLDIATILAVIQSDTGDSISFSMTDDRVLASLKPLLDSFRSIYRINSITQDDAGRPLGLAIGRYSEDTYDGVSNSRGRVFASLSVFCMVSCNGQSVRLTAIP